MPHRTSKISRTGSPMWRGALPGAVLAGLLLAVPGHANTALSVTEVSPSEASPGETVEIAGCGFGTTAEGLVAWVETGEGGFQFDISRAGETGISTIVGPVAAVGTGDVRVWKGRSHRLPDRTLLSQNRLFTISDTTLFVAQETTRGPSFSVLTASPRTASSLHIGDDIIIDLDEVPEERGIRVSAVIETGGGPGTTTSGGGTSGNVGTLVDTFTGVHGLETASPSTSPSWAASFWITADAAPASSARLAQALAEVLEAQFSSLGLTASAQGSQLVVSHTLGIQGGFLTFSY